MSTTAKVQDIFDAAVAKLETISAGSTYLTTPIVQTAKYDQDAVEDVQLLVRIDGWSTDPDSPLGTTQLAVRLHVGVICRQSQTTTAPLLDLPMKAAADVEEALFADVTLGSTAENLDVNSVDNLDLEADGISGLLMQFTISCRYEYGQPE